MFTLDKIYKSANEAPISKILPLLSRFLDPKYKIIEEIDRLIQYSDDPKFFHFGGGLYPQTNLPKEEIWSTSFSGCSFFSEDEALLKCLGEAIERHCIKRYEKRKLIKGSYNEMKNQALDPQTVVCFSEKQRRRPSFKLFNFDKNTRFTWEKGTNLISGEFIFLPAQLIYLSYRLIPQEKIIYPPISTGAAGGSSMVSALVRAIYEIIERDAFLIYYLNKLSGKRIALGSIDNKKIRPFIDAIESYNLKVYLIDITSDLLIPTFLSIVIDETGIGPAVSAGLKTHLDPITAILGSIQEALHPRRWIRGRTQENPRLLEKVRVNNINNIEDRALLWYPKRNIDKLGFWLNQEEKKVQIKERELSFKQQLQIILEILKKNNIETYFVDVTIPAVKKNGYHVVKVIMPQLYPFYLIEKYPFFGGKRLYEVPYKLGFAKRKTKEEKLNKFPHPFI